jgi:hypothetical protein
LSQLAQFYQLKTKGNGQTIGGSLHDRKERDPSQKRVSKERHKEQDGLAHRFRKQTRQKTPLVALYKRSQLAPISCSATLGNKTKNKTLACQPIVLSRTRQRDKRSHRRAGNKDPERCSPNDRLHENKAEKQTVSSTGWEQGPLALLTKRSKTLPNPRSVPQATFGTSDTISSN